MKESRDGNAFYLTVLNVTEEDAGEFTCTVKNGIGKEATNKTYLLVKRKYRNTSASFFINELKVTGFKVGLMSNNHFSIFQTNLKLIKIQRSQNLHQTKAKMPL